jgi:hypothetical protein
MHRRLIIPVAILGVSAVPALAQDHACMCRAADHADVTEKVISEKVVVEDCDAASVCTIERGGGVRWHRPWHPPYRPAPYHPPNRWHPPVEPPVSPPSSPPVTPPAGPAADSQTSTSAGGNTINIYTNSGAADTVSGKGQPGHAVGKDDVALNQRIDMLDARASNLDSWLGKLGWLAALLAVLLAVPVLLLALWALRGVRHDSRSSAADARHAAEAAAELQARLRQKDIELERITEDVALLRRDVERDTRTPRDRVRPASENGVEDVGLVAAGAVAGAAVARHDTLRHETVPVAETDIRLAEQLRQRDLELERIRDELVLLRREVERQGDTTRHTRVVHAHHDHAPAPVETVTVVEEVATQTPAPAAHEPHRHAAPREHPHHAATPHMIDEADWSITHYRVVIGEARAAKHDRAKARQDVIRLSDLMLARYPDNAEAVCFAHVSKADALAEGGDHVAALAECETVTARHGEVTTPAVRTQLAHAHFLKAAIHAQHHDVARCCAALDEWAKVYGIFDKRMIVEDVRFKEIIKFTEFQVYIARKSG